MDYTYWLANSGVTDKVISRIYENIDSAEELYFLTDDQIMKIPRIDEAMLSRLIDSRKSMAELEKSYYALFDRGISFLSMEDDNYPDRLRSINGAPFAIYVKGKLDNDRRPAAAIVGARNCSEYGYAMAKELGRMLALADVTVISGMARGVDAAGHTGALISDGITIAVLGGGVDVVYPGENRHIYNEIIDKGGAIISEHIPGTKPLASYFPMRNRIISGLSDVVVVVEAKERSGSLITADYALEQGKDIYAVPGRITDSLSAGCNNLIHQGAGIITDIGGFIKELDLLPENTAEQMTLDKIFLEKEELLVYSGIDLRPKSIEDLLQKTGLSVPEMLQILLSLEQKGFITETFKNFYIRRF